MCLILFFCFGLDDDCNISSLCLGKRVPSWSLWTICKNNHLKLECTWKHWVDNEILPLKMKWSNWMHNHSPWCKKWLEPSKREPCVMEKWHHQLWIGMKMHELVKPNYQPEMEMEIPEFVKQPEMEMEQHYQRHGCNSFSLFQGKMVPSLSVCTLCKSNHLKS